MVTLWVVLLNSWWTILWGGFCRTGMQNHLFKLFWINWLPGKQSAAFWIRFLHRYISQSGPWEPKKVETSNPWGGWKDLTPFIRWIMNNLNWCQQSGLTFWKDVQKSHHHIFYEVLIAEFSQDVEENRGRRITKWHFFKFVNNDLTPRIICRKKGWEIDLWSKTVNAYQLRNMKTEEIFFRTKEAPGLTEC